MKSNRLSDKTDTIVQKNPTEPTAQSQTGAAAGWNVATSSVSVCAGKRTFLPLPSKADHVPFIFHALTSRSTAVHRVFVRVNEQTTPPYAKPIRIHTVKVSNHSRGVFTFRPETLGWRVVSLSPCREDATMAAGVAAAVRLRVLPGAARFRTVRHRVPFGRVAGHRAGAAEPRRLPDRHVQPGRAARVYVSAHGCPQVWRVLANAIKTRECTRVEIETNQTVTCISVWWNLTDTDCEVVCDLMWK